MDKTGYGVYVLTDECGRIAAVASDAFLLDTTGWTKIDTGTGDRFHHAQGNYFNPPIMDDRGILRYKMENGKPIERTASEMDADYVTTGISHTTEDRIAAIEAMMNAFEAAYLEGVNEA